MIIRRVTLLDMHSSPQEIETGRLCRRNFYCEGAQRIPWGIATYSPSGPSDFCSFFGGLCILCQGAQISNRSATDNHKHQWCYQCSHAQRSAEQRTVGLWRAFPWSQKTSPTLAQRMLSRSQTFRIYLLLRTKVALCQRGFELRLAICRNSWHHSS